MNVEKLRETCLEFPLVTEDMPFDDTTVAFRIKSKIFALLSLDDDPPRINLKCDPEYALELREKYPENVLPGYHMNKKHWNTVLSSGKLSQEKMKHLIKHSYDLVVSKLPKKQRKELKNISND